MFQVDGENETDTKFARVLTCGAEDTWIKDPVGKTIVATFYSIMFTSCIVSFIFMFADQQTVGAILLACTTLVAFIVFAALFYRRHHSEEETPECFDKLKLCSFGICPRKYHVIEEDLGDLENLHYSEKNEEDYGDITEPISLYSGFDE